MPPLPMPLKPCSADDFAVEIMELLSQVYAAEGRAVNFAHVRKAISSAISARDFALVTSSENALGGTV